MLKPNFKNYTENDYNMLLDCILSAQGLMYEECDAKCGECNHKQCCDDIDRLLDTVSRTIQARQAVEKLVEMWKVPEL